MTGYPELSGIGVEEPKGATPAQALAAIRAEKTGETYSDTELARQRAECQESGEYASGGFVAAGGFAMPCFGSRQPFRLFADFVGADPRFREKGEPVKVSQDDAPIILKPCRNADLIERANQGEFDFAGGEITLNSTDWNGASLTLAPGSTISGTLTTGYPDGNPKTAAGAKKPDPTVIPPVAILHLATAMMNGAEKYGPFNWRDQPISYRPYLAAAMRHLASCLDGEDFSQDTEEAGLPVHHLGHVMACCAIVLDAIHCGTITDNRPKVPGQTGNAIERYNVEKKLLPTPQSA
jgi:hypothetical protein